MARTESSIEDEYGCKNAEELTSIWSHWFFYGATGSGKTRIASTFPRPVFLVPQNEKSITTLRGMNIPYYEIVDMDKTPLNPKTGRGGMMAVIDKLEQGYRRNPNGFPFDTVVLESLTHYGDLIQEQITQGAAKAMTTKDWGTVASHVRTLQSRLRSLDVHAVFTALDRTETSDDGKVVIGGPYLTGQLASKLPSACDVIGYCEVQESKKPIYRVHFRRYKHFPARSRFKQLPTFVENFHFADVEHVLERDDLDYDSTEQGEADG